MTSSRFGAIWELNLTTCTHCSNDAARSACLFAFICLLVKYRPIPQLISTSAIAATSDRFAALVRVNAQGGGAIASIVTEACCSPSVLSQISGCWSCCCAEILGTRRWNISARVFRRFNRALPFVGLLCLRNPTMVFLVVEIWLCRFVYDMLENAVAVSFHQLGYEYNFHQPGFSTFEGKLYPLARIFHIWG